MMPIRPLVPLLLLAAACGGDGGGVSDPVPDLVLQKATVSGDSQSAVVASTLPTPIAVRVLSDGSPAAGVVVTFAPSAGAGSALPAVDTTGVDGAASTQWTLGTGAGIRNLSVFASGASGSPILFRATAQTGAAASLTAGSGQSQTQEAGMLFPQALIVRVFDGFGNGVPGVVIAWEIVSGSGGLSQSADTTGGDGRASVTVTAGDSAGELTVRATTAPLPDAPVQFALTVTPQATHVTVASNFFSPAATTIPVGGAVLWTWTSGTHNVTPVSGPATFPGSINLSPSATYGPIVFDVAGVYTYECTLHDGMTGTITVGAAIAPPPAGVQ